MSRDTAAQIVSGLQVISDRLSKESLISDKIKQAESAVFVLKNAETCLTIPSNPVVRICKKDAL